MTVFSKNLKRFRLAKSLTQEQAADALGVSAQSVSRWECGTTLPDITILPRIARLYCVTIDDLYKEHSVAYDNYAQRLVSVYEASGRSEDFLAAEQECARIPAGDLTADDLRSWGVLYHYMMKYCASKALKKLEQAMAYPNITEDIFSSAAQQKIALLCDLGRGSEEAARYDRELSQDPSDPQRWLLCAAAHYMTGENDRALEVVLEGIRRFPDMAALHVYAGDICHALKRYEEAFSHWHQALQLDPSFWAARYSMGFCLEELGQYEKARDIWQQLAEDNERRGFEIEAKFPRTREKICADKAKL